MSPGIVLLIVTAAYLVLSTPWGMIFKKKAFIRLICAVSVAVLSFIITLIIKTAMTNPSTLLKIISVIPQTDAIVGKLSEILGTSETLVEILQSILSAATAPIIFIIVFIILMTISSGFIHVIFAYP